MSESLRTVHLTFPISTMKRNLNRGIWLHLRRLLISNPRLQAIDVDGDLIWDEIDPERWT